MNVTKAFSELHDRLPLLKLARTAVEDNGMEKLVCAPERSRGMALPRVALDVFVPSVRVIVVQPGAFAIVQVFPVKPFIHIQADAPF